MHKLSLVNISSDRSTRLVRLLRFKALLVSSAFFFGCQSAADLQLHSSFQWQTEIYAGLPVAMALPQLIASTDTVRVYIEGDGRAWITPTQPSLDPTPRHSFMLQLAQSDPVTTVYLGRPCQYQKNSACKVPLWTSDRFSQAVLNSLHGALDRIKTELKNNYFELIGYSGGGAVALLLAAQREDVLQVQTIAGNLNPAAWVARHSLTPLTNSLEPTDYASPLAAIPQRHFYGAKDKNIPPSSYQDYWLHLAVKPKCSQQVIIALADHEEGWLEAWSQWRDRSLDCN
ncbi:MAG: alpha/beta hydrolase [Gammaproteobacteria bacterium]|nr:alpha/beta hydrolase [Gammaproteobacteria bacterium]